MTSDQQPRGPLHCFAGLNMCNGGEHAAAVWIQNRIVYLATPGGRQRADKATRVSLHAQILALGAASCLSSQTSNTEALNECVPYVTTDSRPVNQT